MANDEIKVQVLKAMNQRILDLGDEDILDIWFSNGVPDEPTEEDYRFIAEDAEEWVCVCKLFKELIEQGEEE